MKKLLPLLFILSSIAVQAQQKRSIAPIPSMVADANYRIGCSLFSDPNNYTTGSSFSFSAPVNNNSYLIGPGGANYNCLYSVPNQAWFVITVNTGGNLYFNFSNTNGYDVDAAIWGPIANNDMANACAATQSTPLTCDYDTGRPDLYINNAQAGQKYVMLVTNYSNANTTINISQPSGGTVTYAMVNLPNCSMIPSATISGTSTTITEGQSATLNLSFTGSSPWNYTLSDGTIGTTYTSPISINVYPTSSQTYTVNSVSNLCGSNSGSGSVGISVTRSISLKSCFPLDGNATDSKGINSGTLQNGVLTTTNRNSEANKALQFDGINDYVSIPTNQLNNNTFAFATWVKLDELPTSIDTEKIIVSLGGTTDEHYLGVEYYNGAPSWKFSSNATKVYSTAIVNTDWHLLVGVRTGGLLKLYVDGALTASTTVSGTAIYSSPLTGRAGSSIANNKFVKGKIDDIKFYSGSLIDPEILLLQNYTNCNDVFADTYISVQSISTSLICTNSAFIVRGVSNNLTIEQDTPFVAELSDTNGSFANPTIIGSSNFLPLTVTVPNTVTGGSYKLRIKYGSIISVNNFDIYVNKLSTYNITGTTTINDGQTANIALNFTGTGPWNYVLSTGLSGAATTSPWIIPVTPDQSTTYTVISAQNVCNNASADGNTSATVTVNFTKQNVTCLPFNGNATDEKGNNTTTVNGALLTENRYGQTNAAYIFNGASNYIEYTTNLLRKREYSMSAWVLASNISGGTQYILSQGETGTNTFQGLALTNSGWQFTSYTDGGAYTASSSTGWAANQWVHLTAVRTYQQLKLYVNGNLVSTTYSSDNIPFKTSDIGRIGTSSSSLGNYFNGKIDDVRLYKGALNDEEVYALYANTGSCPTIENSSVILVKSLSPTTICAGNNINVTYTSSGITPTAGSPLNVQLSDQNGSFTNPTVIGSGISSPISATIPINSASSSLYRVRIVSSGGTPVTSLTSTSLTVSGGLPTATISGGGSIAYGASANLIINFTGTSPWTYAINNGSSQTTSTNPLTIPVSPTSTTTYTITGLSNSCGNGTGIGSATVTVAPNIILGNIASSFCQGQTFTVPFTANFIPTPYFKVELSDASGSFTSPTTIGTGTSSPISVTIPANSSGGIAYKIRIVTTSPIYTSPEFTNLTIIAKPTATLSGTATIDYGQSTNLTLTFTGAGPWTYAINNGSSQTTSTNPLTISVSPTSTTTYTVTSVSNSCGSGTVSGNAIITVNPIIILGTIASSFCYGQTFTIPFTANYTPTPDFKVELSDGNGSFTSPIVIGSGTSSPISVTIPTDAVGGTSYKIRIVSTSPAYTGAAFTNLTIKAKATATISGTTTIDYGQSTNLTVAFGGSGPWTYAINNGSSQTTSTNPLTISVSPTSTTTYTVTSVSNSCGSGTVSGSTIISVNPNIILGSIGATFCQGQTFTVPFTANYTPALNFKVELSDASGSFTSPITIGTGTSSPVAVTIPTSTLGGTTYKIRIVTTSPAYTSPEFTNLTILVKPTATISGTTTINKDKSTKLSIAFTGNGPWTYTINNGTSQTTSTNPRTVAVSPQVTTTYTVTSISNGCGSGTASGSAVITVINDPYLVSCYLFNGNANDGNGDNHGLMGAGASFTTDRFNNPNSALYLNGNNSNSYVEVALDELINNSAYTFSLWYNSQINGTMDGINVFAVMPPQSDEYSSYAPAQSLTLKVESFDTPTSPLYFGTTCQSGMCFGPFGSVNDGISVNTWYHVVVTRENGVVKLYRNGVLLNTYPVAEYNTNLGGLKGFIGKNLSNNYLGYAYKGKIDDLRIYRRALSSSQVLGLYTQTDCEDIVTKPLITLETVSNTAICDIENRNISISYSAQNVTLPIKVQLSDSNGSFVTPTEIGSGSTNPIAAQIPSNQPNGSGYKIRLVSSDNVSVISNLSQTISIGSPATASISGTTTINRAQSTNLTINFTGSAPWTYKINNGTSQSTSTNPLLVPVTPSTTTTYTITSVSNVCGNGVVTGSSTVVTVQDLPFLISCYPFNGNLIDGKGNNNGTPTAITYTADRFNQPNAALTFTGATGSFLEIPMDELPNMTSYTISAWFSIPDHDYNSYLYGRNMIVLAQIIPNPVDAIQISEWLQVNSNSDRTVTKLRYGNYHNGFVSDAFTITPTVWYHVVLTRKNNVVKIYKDGVLINTRNATVNTHLANNGNLRIYIGRWFGDSPYGYPFRGKVDDVQIYMNALSLGQVQALYKNSANACFDASKFTCLADIAFDAMLNGQQVLSVKNQITGSSSIEAGANIYFDAKNAILLTPGFKTETNAVFTAKPGEGCVD